LRSTNDWQHGRYLIGSENRYFCVYRRADAITGNHSDLSPLKVIAKESLLVKQECLMRKIVFVFTLFIAQAGWTTEYDEGLAAFNNKDYKTALKKWRIAAQRGNADAGLNIGFMYELGLGITQEFKEAARWYRLAALKGHVGAQVNLGVMYGNGQGVEGDIIRAHMWFNIAATGGDKAGINGRDLAAARMTGQQIEQAQRWAQECIESKYEKCE
jgi:hypothetical protein